MEPEIETKQDVAEYAHEQAEAHEESAEEADRETDVAFHEGHVQAYRNLAAKLTGMEAEG